MADKATYVVNSRDREIHDLHISFAPNGTSAPSAVRGTGIRGRGFSISRTGVGVYQITLDDKYPSTALVGFSAGFQNNAAVGHTAEITGGFDMSGASQAFSVTILDASGAAADIAANANNRVFLCLKLQNASTEV